MQLGPQANIRDLNAALQLVSMRALLLTKGSGAAIAVRENGGMVCRASLGASAPPLGYRLDITSGFSGECVRTGKALRCDDSDTDPRVDSASCRQLEIRSIVAVPIFIGRDIAGLLEVFSPQPFAFDDGCLAAVERLARNALAAPRAPRTVSPPKLLLRLEPAHRVFFRNLADTLHPPRIAPLKLTSLPARFWADVFVPSKMPWNRFLQSMLLHVIMIAAMASVLELWQFRVHSVRPLPLNRADVLYYSPAEYLQAQGAGITRTRHPALVTQPAFAVSAEPKNRTQPAITPPDVELRSAARSPQLLPWSSVAPAQPLAADTSMRLGPALSLITVIAPAPGFSGEISNRALIGLTPIAIVGPAPETSAISRQRTFATLPSAVVGPPPSPYPFVRRASAISPGGLEAVGPSPQMPLHDPAALSGVVQAALHGAVSSVIPPPPSAEGAGNPGRRGTALAAALPVGLPPKVIRGATDPHQSATRVVRDPYPAVVQSAREAIAERDPIAGSKELSVNFLGPALTLPASSYFANDEVFLAEDRRSRQGLHLIKLIYEYLPYQPRLSDYGPNYPAVDRLRVVRDPHCDEPLARVLSTVQALSRSLPDRLRPDLRGLDPRANALECYRTTADDYRRARAHQQ